MLEGRDEQGDCRDNGGDRICKERRPERLEAAHERTADTHHALYA